METVRTQALVIGSGPGGYVAAIRLGQLGIQTICVEKEQAGGVCLNVGCIPSKALITASKQYEHAREHDKIMGIIANDVKIDWTRTQAWRGEVVAKMNGGVKLLIKGAGSRLVMGTATFIDKKTVEIKGPDGDMRIEAEHIIIATGSRPIEIPGFKVDQKKVCDSTGALVLTEIPKRLVVIGGGYIGLELGIAYAKLGSKVTVVEFTAGLLPGNDPELVNVVARKLKKSGVEVFLESKALGFEDTKSGGVVKIQTKDGEKSIETDCVFVTVGRKPNSDTLGIEKAGVKVEKGFITVDKQQRTNVPNIYAIGDVASQPMLAHKASKEADVVAEVIAGHKAEMDAVAIPAVIFVDPEIASVGLQEHEAVKAGRKIKVGKYNFAAHGRSVAMAEPDGFVKIIADAETDEVLGFGIVGYEASDLISECVLALEMGAFLPDIAMTVHPHPTLGEAIMEAAKAALGECAHIVGGGQKKASLAAPAKASMKRWSVEDLGRRSYASVLELQHERVAQRQRGEIDDRLLLVEHDDVVTLGRRRDSAKNVLVTDAFPIVEIERGGDATYHGPGQLVAYPILQLDGDERDLHRYLRNLEQAAIDLLAEYGLPGDRNPSYTGAWIGPHGDLAPAHRKIMSIGIAVRRWVTFHGVAFNVATDLAKFGALNPCGLDAQVMTSLGRELGRAVTLDEVKPRFVRALGAAVRRASAAGP